MQPSQTLLQRTLAVLPLIGLGWVGLVFGSVDTEGLRQSSVQWLFASLLARALCFGEWLSALASAALLVFATSIAIW